MNTMILEAAPQQQGGGMQMIIMMVVLFAIVYFFMIRPQNKKQKEIILYYQKMGMTKKRFMQQVSMQSKNQKQRTKDSNMKFYNRMWDVAASGDKAKFTFFEKVMGYNK